MTQRVSCNSVTISAVKSLDDLAVRLILDSRVLCDQQLLLFDLVHTAWRGSPTTVNRRTYLLTARMSWHGLSRAARSLMSDAAASALPSIGVERALDRLGP